MIRPLLLFVVAGCVLPPVDYSQFPCPCPEPEYVCACQGQGDERCVRANEQVTCSRPAPTCDGLFVIDALDRAWNTENVIAIKWNVVTRDESLFDQYIVELTPVSGGETIVVDRETNPELGEYALDRNGSVVERTWLRNLSDTTTYNVRLTAFDRTGGECQLDANLSTRMPEFNGEWVFFRDEPPPRVSPEGECTSIQPGEDDPFVELEVQCEQLPVQLEPTSYCDTREPVEAANSCFVNALIFPEPRPIPTELRLQFPQAVVEFRIRAEGEGIVSSDWSNNLIRTRRQQQAFDANPGPATDVFWGVQGFTVPLNQGSQTFQVPLVEYRHDITNEQISDEDLDVFEWFLVGGTWPNGMRLVIEEARIRW